MKPRGLPGFSVVPVELGDRHGGEPSSTTSSRRAGSMASTVVGFGTNAPKSGPHPAAACSSTIRTVSPIVGPCASSCRAALSRTCRSTSTRTVTFIVVSLGCSTGPFTTVKRRYTSAPDTGQGKARHSSVWKEALHTKAHIAHGLGHGPHRARAGIEPLVTVVRPVDQRISRALVLETDAWALEVPTVRTERRGRAIAPTPPWWTGGRVRRARNAFPVLHHGVRPFPAPVAIGAGASAPWPGGGQCK